MTTFYKKCLPSAAPSAANAKAGEKAMADKTDKMSILEAFRTTQNEMRERFINPYSWAGFVLVE